MKSSKNISWLYALIALIGSAYTAAPALAHGDEDHGDERAPIRFGGPGRPDKSAGVAGGTFSGPQDALVKAARFDQRLDAQVPMDATFRDDDGKTVKFGDLFQGKPVILVGIYYKCTTLCSEVLKETVRSVKELKFTSGQEYNLVAISIDPRETPKIATEEKAEYLKEYNRPGAEKGWHFLTGDEKQIRRVTDAIGMHYAYDEKSGQYAHPNGALVLTPHGKVARYFGGITYPSRDLKFALMEASVDKIGSPVDQLFLTCFHYDPVTGKYGVLITQVLRLSSAALILLMAGGISLSVWREKKRPNSAKP